MLHRIVFFIVLLFIIGCGKVQQAPVNLNDYIAGLDPDAQDIPLQNIPGHELPECPLECVCPKWFGLSKNPCIKEKPCVKPMPKIVWHRFDDDLLKKAKKDNRLVILFYVSYLDVQGYNILDNLGKDECFLVESWKHYYLSRTDNLDLYYHALNDHSKNLGVARGNIVTSPAVAVFHNGYVLPISFESKVWFSTGDLPYHPTNPSHLCLVAKALYKATR